MKCGCGSEYEVIEHKNGFIIKCKKGHPER